MVNTGARVGERLRAIRRQKGLSLHDVEARSSLEFKASVLGAYERGERAISVPRLQRLARFYNVPVDQLLPQDEGPGYAARYALRVSLPDPGGAGDPQAVLQQALGICPFTKTLDAAALDVRLDA